MFEKRVKVSLGFLKRKCACEPSLSAFREAFSERIIVRSKEEAVTAVQKYIFHGGRVSHLYFFLKHYKNKRIAADQADQIWALSDHCDDIEEIGKIWGDAIWKALTK